MTTAERAPRAAAPDPAPDGQVVTPRAGAMLRSWRFWLGIGVIVVIAAVAGVLVRGANGPAMPLDPGSAAPNGSRALVQVLRAHGVDVRTTSRLEEALAAADGATLLLHDPASILDSVAVARLADAGAARIVLLEPGAVALEELAPDVMVGPPADGSVSADCEVPVVRRAGEVAGDARTYLVRGDAVGCWRSEGDYFRSAFVDDRRIAVVGTTGAFMNEQIVLSGNAAFALGVLGAQERLVWFSPSILEASGEAPPTLGDLSPAWVVPLVLLLGAVFVAAAVWRGRRLGPLVVEPLPVAVRADETMRGRARLYARAGARLRAVDALRLGALDRIAPLLGLPSSADAEQVAVSAAALTGRPVGGLRALLRDAVPASDGDLVRLANDLAELETAVRRATGRH